jgi:hypothetical protein
MNTSLLPDVGTGFSTESQEASGPHSEDHSTNAGVAVEGAAIDTNSLMYANDN